MRYASPTPVYLQLINVTELLKTPNGRAAIRSPVVLNVSSIAYQATIEDATLLAAMTLEPTSEIPVSLIRLSPQAYRGLVQRLMVSPDAEGEPYQEAVVWTVSVPRPRILQAYLGLWQGFVLYREGGAGAKSDVRRALDGLISGTVAYDRGVRLAVDLALRDAGRVLGLSVGVQPVASARAVIRVVADLRGNVLTRTVYVFDSPVDAARALETQANIFVPTRNHGVCRYEHFLLVDLVREPRDLNQAILGL